MIEKRRLAWFILVRVLVVSVFLASTLILNIRGAEHTGSDPFSSLIRLIVATYLFSIVSLIFLRFSDRLNRLLTYAQIVWDLLLVTLLLLLTGGINSPYSFLYVLSIISASVFLARREAFYTASLCGILYGAILDLQYYGRLAPLGLSQAHAQQIGANSIIYTIFVNIVVFYLTAFLTGYLAERARTSETALKEKVIDFEELAQLHSSIVSSLDSGLLTINEEGRVRVFNRYAEQLTGMTQEEAYDRLLGEVIPEFGHQAGQGHGYQIGEFEYRAAGGRKMTIGYKSVPLSDKDGNRCGVIIAFRDLTKIRQMEVALKKADRLAAIGELSARIAHEIRNPLASISGSVQLIAQGERVKAADRKLLDIVLRETDRLNGLISDFLLYARPTPQKREHLQLKRLIADLSPLLASDPRFVNVVLQIDIADDILVIVDGDQFKQLLWNLLVNAAEAMPEGGTVNIRALLLTDAETGISMGDVARIEVRDTGVGMAKGDAGKVFEPFFTTKTGGSGLGLATVYRIVEANGGTIQVESEEGAGTTFTIFLPAENVAGISHG